MTLTPAQNGFLKGLILTVLAAVVGYVADPSHLTFLSGSLAAIVAALASATESHIKDVTGYGLFGATDVQS